MSITVSVIIPVYNVAPYLPACLESVLGQMLEGLEVVCVNDCSPDRSGDILAAYGNRDNRLHILHHAENRGLAAARNTGLAAARGEYVYFLDSDDLLAETDSLAMLLAIARRDGADEVVGATLRWDEASGETTFGYHGDYLTEELAGVRFADFPLLRHNAIACNKLLRRLFLDEHGLRFREDLRKFEDNVFSWQAHLLARSISLTLKPTYRHRLRAADQTQSIMQQKANDGEYHVRAAGYMLDFLEANPRFHALRHHFDRYFLTWCYLDVREADSRQPSAQEKTELLQRYLQVLARVPATSLQPELMPARYREGLRLLREEEFLRAWQVFATRDFQAVAAETAAGGNGHGQRTGAGMLAGVQALLKKIRRL